MKRFIVSLLLCGAALVTGLQAQSAEDLAKVKFTGVKSMRIVDEAGMRLAYVTLQVSNSSANELVMTDGSFNLAFLVLDEKAEKKRAESWVADGKKIEDLKNEDHIYKEIVRLPMARPSKQAKVPKGSMMSSGTGTIEIIVTLGDTSSDTTERTLIPLFNLISAEVQQKMKVEIAGSIRFGVKVGDGIVFRSEEILWTLVPKPMDRVMFGQ